MTRKKPKVVLMNEFIWSLKGKCEGICEMNRNMIEQYCRFSCMADDTSVRIEQAVKDGADPETIEGLMKNYERFLKAVLNLHKVLKFDQIKEQLEDLSNPFTELIKENRNGEDF